MTKTTELHQVENDNNKYYYTPCHEADLARVVDLQVKVATYTKQPCYKEPYQSLLIVADLTDGPSFARERNY